MLAASAPGPTLRLVSKPSMQASKAGWPKPAMQEYACYARMCRAGRQSRCKIPHCSSALMEHPPSSLRSSSPQNGNFEKSAGDLPTRKKAPNRGRFRLFARPYSRDRTGWRRSAGRTGLQSQFPANREFYREFRGMGDFIATLEADCRRITKIFGRIPWIQEQGIPGCKQGLLFPEHGSLRLK